MIFDNKNLDQSLTEFMRYVPVYLAPILYHADYQGRLLPESEVMVIMTLFDQGPLSPTGICRLLNMQKGSLTSVLKRLENLGLIARRSNPEDERSYLVELSANGAEFTRLLGTRRQHELHTLFETMEPRDQRMAANGLELISTHFRKLEEIMMTRDQEMQHKSLNWYQAASPEDRREYDTFGPWLTEIKVEEDMPRRFRSLYADHADARFLMKVPKNADRRQLRPGMDLYDALIAVDDDGIFLARLHESGVWTQHSTWDDIASVGSYGDRLHGIWTLFLKDGNRPSLTFNKVSSALMDEVTDFVRGHLRDAEAANDSLVLEENGIEFSDDDLFFGSALMELRRRGPEAFNPLYFEPQGQPCVDEDGKRGVSTGVLFLDSPSELVIVNREKPVHPRGEALYASNDIFIPYACITDFSVLPAASSKDGQFQTLILRMNGQTIEQPCLQAPDAVLAALQGRTGSKG